MSEQARARRSLRELGDTLVVTGRRIRKLSRADVDPLVIRQVVDELQSTIWQVAEDLGVHEEN